MDKNRKQWIRVKKYLSRRIRRNKEISNRCLEQEDKGNYVKFQEYAYELEDIKEYIEKVLKPKRGVEKKRVKTEASSLLEPAKESEKE